MFVATFPHNKNAICLSWPEKELSNVGQNFIVVCSFCGILMGLLQPHVPAIYPRLNDSRISARRQSCAFLLLYIEIAFNLAQDGTTEDENC